jgi:hypothetical protein
MRDEPAAAIRDDGGVVMLTAYDAAYVDEIKLKIPRDFRKYDPASHAWTAFEPYADVALKIASARFVVTVDDRRRGPAPPPSWAQAMFDGLPERLHDGVYRSLLRTFQADIGADPTAAEQLVTEYERRRKAVAS